MTMNEQLIDVITKEVLRRLQALEMSNQNSKRAMLVLAEEGNPLPERIKREYQIMESGSINSLKPSELISLIDSAECLLIPSLSATQLASLALGCGEGGLCEGVRYALLLGKTIYLLEEGLTYRGYRKTAYKTYYRRLLEYEECIKSYGIQILEQEMLPLGLNQLSGKEQEKIPDVLNYSSDTVQEKPGKNESYRIDKKLILEKDLMNLSVKTQSVVWIGKNSIVTPSALDYARAHHIQIIKK